jgi:hypothetical protein
MKIIVHMAIKMAGDDDDSDLKVFENRPPRIISAHMTPCGGLEIVDRIDLHNHVRCGFAPGTWIKWEKAE